MKKNDKAHFVITIDLDVYEKCAAYCIEEHISFSKFVEGALSYLLADIRWLHSVYGNLGSIEKRLDFLKEEV